MSFDLSILENTSPLGFLLVFLGGLVTSLGPCNLTMIPLVIGFVGGSSRPTRWYSFGLSLSFVVGLAITFMLLGLAAAWIGGLIGGATRLWYYLVAGVCFAIGLQMAGVLQLHWPSWLGGLREQIRIQGIPGALALGLVSGLVASQCATPVLAAILTIVMAQKGALLYGALLLFIYSLGRGIPILIAGTFTGALKNMQFLNRWSGWIEKASAAVVILVGVYFLWTA